VPKDAPIAQLFAQACEQAGQRAVFSTTYGGGDANPFNNKGLECVVFGLGMQAIHTLHEAILLSDLTLSAEILRRAITTPA